MSNHVRWHDLPEQEIENHFNPRIAVADAAERLDAWTSFSATLDVDVRRDIRYGDGPRMTLDVYPATVDAPTVVFIHGGYWRRLDKSVHVFAADGLRRMGANVVALNYDLCPSITLTRLNAEIAEGIRYVAANADALGLRAGKLHVVGHSAGGHAAAWAASDPDLAPLLAGVVPISGVFDTRAVRLTSINDDVKLDEGEAHRMNVFARPPGQGIPVLAIVGGEEPPAWIGESAGYCDHVRTGGGGPCHLEIVPGTNHFSVLEAATDPASGPGRSVAAFLAG